MVIGDHNNICASGGNLSHGRTFGGVSIAIGAKEEHHLSSGDRSDSCQQASKCFRGVAVIKIENRTFITRDNFGATRNHNVDLPSCTEGMCNVFKIKAGLHQHDNGQCCIGSHKTTQERDGGGEFSSVGPLEDKRGCSLSLRCNRHLPVRCFPAH